MKIKWRFWNEHSRSDVYTLDCIYCVFCAKFAKGKIFLMENYSVPHNPWSGFCISNHTFFTHTKKCPCKDKEALVTFLIGVCTEGIQPTALLLHLNTFSCDERVFLKEFWDSVLGFVISVAWFWKRIAWIAVYSIIFVVFVLFCLTFLMKLY